MLSSILCRQLTLFSPLSGPPSGKEEYLDPAQDMTTTPVQVFDHIEWITGLQIRWDSSLSR